MPRTLRIAVLECDTLADAIVQQRGNYGKIYAQLLDRGNARLRAAGQDVRLQVTAWDVVNAQVYPSLDEIDCIWLSGSRHAAVGYDPWILKLVDFVRLVAGKSSIPIVGICFGHQIIGRAFGAQVGSNEAGWEIAVTNIDLTPEGKEIFQVDSLALHQMHRDAVFEPPKGFVNLGSTSSCAVQGLCKPGRVLSVQAHPEFDEDVIRYLLDTRHVQGIVDDRLYEDARLRLSLEHDGVWVSAAILRFVLDAIKQDGDVSDHIASNL